MMLTKKEIMEKYNVSNETIKRRTKEGKLNPIKAPGNKNLYDENEVDKLFNIKKVDPLEELKKLLLDHYGYEPYEFLGEYVNISTPIKLICHKCEKEIQVSPGNMKNNMNLNRQPPCKYCGAVNSVKDRKKDTKSYLESLPENSYELLEEYVTSDTPITHKCLKCNYEFKATPSNVLYAFKKGRHYCPKCNKMIRETISYEEKLKKVNSNIVPLEPYKGRKIKIKHKCTICEHEWDADPNNRLGGEGCPKCANKITQSKDELEVIQFLEENKIKIKTKDRIILNGKEIDILCEDYNIGIEFDGGYWHSEKYKSKKYHLEKTLEANKKNIRLIHILDDEWRDKKNIVKSKLKYLLKCNSDMKKIYARKCYVEEIDSSIKNQFLEANHIQGKDFSNIKLGLWHPADDGDELVAVMTFCKPRGSLGQKDSRYDYELSRFATDLECIVPGGFSKLFSYFKKNYKWNKIITYADKRYSEGNVYIKNGWNHLHDSKPNYWYVNKNTKKRYHRYSFRKQVLKDKFPNYYKDELTEFQIMDKTEYFRIWDCGNMVFEYCR